MTLLDVSHLTVRTSEGDQVVSDVSFSLDAGERLGLIGESGSGKSVTSLALMGLLDDGLTASGSVMLNGVEIVGTPDRQLSSVRGAVASIVFQEPLSALDPLMRVGKQIAEPMRRHLGLRRHELREAVQAALAEVSLTDPRIADAFPHELSGGQRQRVAIAIALAANPRLLIADEPTTALDVTVQTEVLALLDGLVAKHDMALLFVSHDFAVISLIVDRVVVLRRGVAVESGDVREVLKRPQDPYTRQLVKSAQFLDSALSVGPDAADGAVTDGELT